MSGRSAIGVVAARQLIDGAKPRPNKRFAAVAEERCGYEALALRLALRIGGMLAAQQNRETLGRSTE